MDQPKHLETLCAQAGLRIDPATGAVAPPLPWGLTVNFVDMTDLDAVGAGARPAGPPFCGSRRRRIL